MTVNSNGAIKPARSATQGGRRSWSSESHLTPAFATSKSSSRRPWIFLSTKHSAFSDGRRQIVPSQSASCQATRTEIWRSGSSRAPSARVIGGSPSQQRGSQLHRELPLPAVAACRAVLLRFAQPLSDFLGLLLVVERQQ